jgi:aminoglycoside phosphotransferase (APT) family kinase protein
MCFPSSRAQTNRSGGVAKPDAGFCAENQPLRGVVAQQEPTRSPDAALAAAIVERAVGSAPSSVRRFATGAQHYVFDVAFVNRPPLVARIGGADSHGLMAGALYLSGLLRPRGVPLPAVLAADVEATFLWLLLERLPGTDLGAVIGDLSRAQRAEIAARVAAAQAIVARTPAAGRYGFAARPEAAPHTAWAPVLEASLARSRQRIVAAGLFDIALVDRAADVLSSLRAEINAVAATPFLHDTTTRNVIVTDAGEFSGIVDVDDLCFGDPRYPAALTLAVLTASDGPIDYVAAWFRHAGWRDDRLFQFTVALFLLDLMSEHGQVFNGNEAGTTAIARAKLLREYEAALARVPLQMRHQLGSSILIDCGSTTSVAPAPFK